jgi:acyl-coenzyme A thioesterase PaaI-like protein
LVGTAGIHYDHVAQDKVVVSIKNRRAVQNHIKGVHAAAMALLAETATGFVTVLNVPDDRIVLIKTLQVNYKKVAKGGLTATATLSDEQRKFIADNEKGELVVPITVVDESGIEPIECTMIWCWLPKKKK